MDALVHAVKKKQIELVRSMLQNGADPNSTCNQLDGKSLLSLAIRNHDLDMVKLLLEFNANINYTEPTSKISILQFALLECFDEAVELLIKNGANINYVTFYGLTALHLAIERRDEKMVLLLLKLGADPNVKQPASLPFMVAASRFTQAVAEIRLSRGFNTNRHIDYVSLDIFEIAKTKLQYHKAQYVLHSNPSAVAKRWTGLPALQFAASHGCPNLVQLLLNHGALVDQRNETDSKCVNPLFEALTKGDDDTVYLLIERGADVNTRNRKGRTPLHLAAYYDCSKAAELLINRGVPIDVADCEKITPLHMAAENNRPDMVDLLISRGADVNACSRAELYTSLHHAVSNDNRNIALRLLKSGALVMITRPGQAKEKTSLEVAVSRRDKHVQLIKILFKCVLERESQVDRRDAFAHLVQVNNWQLLGELIVMFLARLDEGLQHDFFVRNEIEPFESFYEMCVNELTAMKTFVVYKKLTLHDVFARRGWQGVNLMRNTMLLKVLMKCDYMDKYPIYAHMLKEHLNEAKTLKEQHLDLQDALTMDFIPHYRLEAFPHIVENILDFLQKDEINELHSLMQTDSKDEKDVAAHLQ